MDKYINALDSFLSDESNFIVKLRFLDGLDKENVQIFMNILDTIGKEIKEEDFIIKRLAFLLVEIVPILQNLVDFYSGREREEILHVIALISMKISEILES